MAWDDSYENYQEVLSPLDAHRAIYIDFEGFKDQPPALLGTLWAYGRRPTDKRLRCVHDIHHTSLQQITGAVELKTGFLESYEQRAYSIEQSINGTARLAEAQNRLIVSWSTHELVQIAEGELSPELFEFFRGRYRDGKATAKAWFKQAGLSTATGSNKLVRYLKEAGYPLPDYYGLGQTTQRLRSVIAGVQKRGSYSKLVASQQEKWYHLLFHNLVDCHGLRHVTKFAALELADLPWNGLGRSES
jgi:hypothetical protein